MRQLQSYALVLTALAGLSACRANAPSDGVSGGPSGQVGDAAAPRVEVPSPTTTAAASTLPKLKPVLKKPFPEGADERVVCEAVHSKETDLWARYGHIVPLYVRGALYVLTTKSGDSEKLRRFIEKEYVHPHHVQQAGCGDDAVLLYLRDMVDESVFGGRPFGRRHLSSELDKRFGVQTRESFQINDDPQRLAAYCRSDAELCDALVKLDEANGGMGLCFKVGVMLNIEEDDAHYRSFHARCRSYDVNMLACSHHGLRGAEALSCEQKLRRLLAR